MTTADFSRRDHKDAQERLARRSLHHYLDTHPNRSTEANLRHLCDYMARTETEALRRACDRLTPLHQQETS